eukprot:Gb_37466 [translate_table: standard]
MCVLIMFFSSPSNSLCAFSLRLHSPLVAVRLTFVTWCAYEFTVNSMRRSWSVDSLMSNKVRTWTCTPITHAGSFQCCLYHLAAHDANAQSFIPLPPPSNPSRQSTSSRTVKAQ